MLAALLAILSSSTVGTIVGGVIGWFNRRTDLQSKQLDQAHERAKWASELAAKDKDLAIMQAEANGKREVAVVEGQATVEKAAYEAMSAAYAEDSAPSTGAMDGLRKSVRPVLTYVLVESALVVNGVLAWLMLKYWATLDKETQTQLVLGAVAWITAQASAVIGFWFVSRPATFK